MMVIDISETGSTPATIADEMLRRGFFIRAASYTTRRFTDRYVRVSFSVPTVQVENFTAELLNLL